MKKEMILVISNLKKNIETSKKNGLFNLAKLCSSDFATLKTGTKEIKRIEEFKELKIEELPASIVNDEELYTVIYHFILIEEQKKFLNYDLDMSHKVGLKLVDYPNTDKRVDDEVIEDAVEMENLFDALADSVSERKDDEVISISTKSLTKSQVKIYNLLKKGFSPIDIANKLNKDISNIRKSIKMIYKSLNEENEN